MQPLPIEIDAQHAAAIGPQQLHREQSDEAQSGHHERLAQRGRRQPDPLECYGTEHREGGGFIIHRIGNARHEIARHRDDLGMPAIRHHALARLEAAGPRA